MAGKIPESVLLKVFRKLSLQDRTSAALVCSQWARITDDPFLWRETELRRVEISEAGAKRLMRKMAQFVRKLDLSGCSIPASLIWDMSKNCHQLKTLCLQGCRLNNSPVVQSLSLPCFEALENLDLRFLYGDDQKPFTRILPKLKNIQCLGMNVNSGNDLTIIISSLKNLRVFHCQNCSSFTDSHIEMLGKYCSNMESLCFTGCIYVTGATFPDLLENCKKLRTLLLSCTRLKNEHILRTDWGSSAITELDISYCYGISSTGLKAMLPQLTRLRYLQIAFCGWGRALDNDVIKAMAEVEFGELEILDIHSNFEINGKMLCRLLSKCPAIRTLCVGNIINTDDDLATLFYILPNLRNFYITKQSTIKTETLFLYIAEICPQIETLALCNFYAIERQKVESSLIKLAKNCKRLKTLCIRGTNVLLRAQLTLLANRVKDAAKRNDIKIALNPQFLLSAAALSLDNVTRFSERAT